MVARLGSVEQRPSDGCRCAAPSAATSQGRCSAAGLRVYWVVDGVGNQDDEHPDERARLALRRVRDRHPGGDHGPHAAYIWSTRSVLPRSRPRPFDSRLSGLQADPLDGTALLRRRRGSGPDARYRFGRATAAFVHTRACLCSPRSAFVASSAHRAVLRPACGCHVARRHRDVSVWRAAACLSSHRFRAAPPHARAHRVTGACDALRALRGYSGVKSCDLLVREAECDRAAGEVDERERGVG